MISSTSSGDVCSRDGEKIKLFLNPVEIRVPGKIEGKAIYGAFEVVRQYAVPESSGYGGTASALDFEDNNENTINQEHKAAIDDYVNSILDAKDFKFTAGSNIRVGWHPSTPEKPDLPELR